MNRELRHRRELKNCRIPQKKKKQLFLESGLIKFPTLYDFGTPEILNLGGVPFNMNRLCLIKTIDEGKHVGSMIHKHT